MEKKGESAKNKVMIKRIYDIDYSEVDTELEAIMLETNLIKELRPKYNVLMKDDKNFIYIKITVNEDYPMVYLTRQMVKDGSIYFGPKTSGYAFKEIAKLFDAFFPYKKCKLNVETLKDGKIKKSRDKKYPCLIYQLDKGHEPCISLLPKAEYRQIIDKIIGFMKGQHNDLLKGLKDQMAKYAEDKEFEKAGSTRDKIKYLEQIIERQKISAPTQDEMDVLDIIESYGTHFANLFQIREGKLVSQENFVIKNEDEQDLTQVYEGFIKQYYAQAGSIPKNLLIPQKVNEQALIEKMLAELRGSKCKIVIPKVGRKHALIKLATKNAESYARQMRVKWMSEKKHDPYENIKSLKTILKLPKVPTRIECYDISHLAGTETVGSMVVFEGGQPKRHQYRIFNIKSLEDGEINDFDSITEVLNRRLKYVATLPTNTKLRKKKGTYTLTEDKTELMNLTFEGDEKETRITDVNVLDRVDLIGRFLGTIILKLKSKKTLINLSDNVPAQELIDLGFIEIDHKDFSYGYYSTKSNVDASLSSKPDLIVIDGGKGQLSAALKARDKKGLDIPMVSLAKRNEEIFLSDKTKIVLPKNSGELNLMQHLRNEAHRFAIERNRKNRIKSMTKKTP